MKKLAAFLLSLCILAAPCLAAASAADFSDVKPGDWYYGAVDFAASNALFSGTSATAFSPDSPMTRGMFVTVIGKYSGAAGYAVGSAGIKEAINLRAGPGTNYAVVTTLRAGDTAAVYSLENGWYSAAASGASGYIRADLISVSCGPFRDVAAGDYYARYVNWAYAGGIVSGTSETTFEPERNVSREELCAILYKLAQKRGLALPESVPQTAFSDEASISPAFVAAVYAMQRAGVAAGRDDGTFAPLASASRAETAAMLEKFIQGTGARPAAAVDFSVPLPESAAVSDAYFSGACFIGHSIVQGMQTTFGLSDADFYAVNGSSAAGMLTYDKFTLPNGGAGKLETALSQKTYGKVYVMLGVNELSSSDYKRNNFASAMGSILSLVREKQPGAKIYVISLTPVTKTQSDSGSSINLSNIRVYDGMLQSLCRERSAGYVDFFTLFADADGYMPPEGAAPDGIHPVVGQYAVMKQYLKTHTYQ